MTALPSLVLSTFRCLPPLRPRRPHRWFAVEDEVAVPPVGVVDELGLAHLMRHRHGGRRARVRGRDKVAADFSLLAAAVNLARLAVLSVASIGAGAWAVAAG